MMPQEGRCPCLFQATRKFEQLNIVNPRGQAARIVFRRSFAQSEVLSVSLSAFATSDVSQSKGIKKVRRAVIAKLIENLWQFIRGIPISAIFLKRLFIWFSFKESCSPCFVFTPPYFSVRTNLLDVKNVSVTLDTREHISYTDFISDEFAIWCTRLF